MIIVFLKHKLLTCDTIVPLLQEIQQRRKHKVYFIVPRVQTENYIKKNIVLYDLMKSMGSVSAISSIIAPRASRSAPNGGSKVHTVLFLIKLISLSLFCFLKKGHVIHFGNTGAIISKIMRINERRMVFVESDNFGFTDFTRRAETAGGLLHYSNKEQQQDFYGSNLLIFSEHFKINDYNINNKDVFYFGKTRARKSWINHIKKESPKYLNSFFSQEKLTPTLSIVYIMTSIGDLPCIDNKDSMMLLFKETLRILVKEANGIPILIKPHIITDVEIIKKEISKYPNAKILLTDLHPAVLSNTAMFFIGNYYSTVFGDAAIWGIPTIEFTSYKSKVLKETNQGSISPDHVTYFINNNQQMLQKVVSKLIINSNLNNNKIKTTNEKNNNSFFQLFD